MRDVDGERSDAQVFQAHALHVPNSKYRVLILGRESSGHQGEYRATHIKLPLILSSFLEDRIKRLEELAATGVQLDPAVVNSLKSNTNDAMDTGDGRDHYPGPLHIDTSITANHSTFEDSAFYSVDTFNSEIWSYPATPAAYSDMGPDVEGWWSQEPSTDIPMATEPDFNFFANTHRRAQTFPAVPVINHSSRRRDSHSLLSPCSDIPSIQITSHEGSNSPSPALHPIDSSAWALPFRDSLSLPASIIAEPTPQAVHRSPLLSTQDFNFQDSVISGEYYGDFLSPLDRPPALSRRPSISSSTSKPGMNNVSEWTTRVSSPNSNPIEPRSKRRHTTCSIPRTSLSTASKLALSPEASWMLSSSRTTNYLNKYFTSIHPQYPFLKASDFLPHPSEFFASPLSTTRTIQPHRNLHAPNGRSHWRSPAPLLPRHFRTLCPLRHGFIPRREPGSEYHVVVCFRDPRRHASRYILSTRTDNTFTNRR